jgi:hypothetical protein
MSAVAATGRILEGLGGRGNASRRSEAGVNARDNVTEFYAGHNYVVVGEAETLFGVVRMCE